MFQLGHHLAFDAIITVMETTGEQESTLTLTLTIDTSGRQLPANVLEYTFSGQVGQKVRKKTEPFFLHPTGDAVLRNISIGLSRADLGRTPKTVLCNTDLCAFSIEETANKAAALVAGIFIALVSAGVGALVSWLLTCGG